MILISFLVILASAASISSPRTISTRSKFMQISRFHDRFVSESRDGGINESLTQEAKNIKLFTDYHVYFKTAYKLQYLFQQQKQTSEKNYEGDKQCTCGTEKLFSTSSSTCLSSLSSSSPQLHHRFRTRNKTNYQLTSTINRCANEYYFPRIVTPTQISWKRVERKKLLNHTKQTFRKRMLNTTANSNPVSYDGLTNYSHSNDTNTDEDTDSNGSQVNENDSTRNETVHKYMAFGLLLPSHPFSDDLIYNLKVVAPMFPQVKLVVGNGYQFKYLCSQYGVNSFPQLLLFTEGLLKGM